MRDAKEEAYASEIVRALLAHRVAHLDADNTEYAEQLCTLLQTTTGSSELTLHHDTLLAIYAVHKFVAVCREKVDIDNNKLDKRD